MEIPDPGFGTFQVTDPEQCQAAVETALEVGYRHVDTAHRYENERAVGRAIAASEVPRDEIYLATKVLHPSVTEDYSYDGIVCDAEACLDRLGVEYVDLLYVHWPSEGYEPEPSFRAFESLVDDGRVDDVGICNAPPRILDEAVETAGVPIVAHQFEYHPFLDQTEVLAATKGHDVTPVSHSSLARGAVPGRRELADIGETYDASAARVALAWERTNGVVALPRSTNPDHIRENFEARTLTLDDEDLARIDEMAEGTRICDPSFGPAW